MTPIGLFKGETALVTGSASNIGRAIAEALAREGASVLLADVDPTRNQATRDAIAALGATAETIVTDLSGKDGWRDLLAKVGSRRLDMFVHSASPPRKETDSPLTVSEETWDGMVNVNVRSGFFLAREIGLAMQRGGIKGRMLFITSLHAYAPRKFRIIRLPRLGRPWSCANWPARSALPASASMRWRRALCRVAGSTRPSTTSRERYRSAAPAMPRTWRGLLWRCCLIASRAT